MPSLIDYYELTKSFEVAQSIADCLSQAEVGGGLNMEIGAGGALVPLLLRGKADIAGYDVIDLPFVIPLGFLMASAFADPDLVALPNETERDAWLRFHVNTDYAFAPTSVDVAVNVTSFHEMTTDNLQTYFELIAEVLKPGGHFVCLNRDVKTTRFADYPWGEIPHEIVEDSEDLLSRFHSDNQVMYHRVLRKIV